MIPITSLRVRLRSLLPEKEQLQRRLPRRSAKPRIGTHVVNVQESLRFVIQAGMSDELWMWLMERRWRVEPYRPDRRRYLEIPASRVTVLIDADPVRREKAMAEAVQSAQRKPAAMRKP